MTATKPPKIKLPAGLCLLAPNQDSALRDRLRLFDSPHSKMSPCTSHADLVQSMHRREGVATKIKQRMAEDWIPEYKPISIIPPTRSTDAIVEKSTSVSAAMILKEVPMIRKTKIVCTLGPACWSEEGLGSLIDAGMDIARFNFSHGTHEDHQRVLDRLRKVAGQKGKQIGLMLDTKGPEIRTAMLKDGKDIDLIQGQKVTIVAVGDAYTSWQGFKNGHTGETKIGLSYSKLCQSVKPGNIILLSDGTISIMVEEIISDTELIGTCLNTHKLGQRKNCNLPGVIVDLPVLGAKDILDVQEFACKNEMDFIAASFVQTPEDVRFIREKLNDTGGFDIKIIAKIESKAGLEHLDEILREADGVMVARGDLAMEVPIQKIALAQKAIITKANIAGKFVICATQMLESMIENDMPTRAEMTDVANAVFDGAHAVMLSGESANGMFPFITVQTMANIVENAELGIDYRAQFDYLRYHISAVDSLTPMEATLCGVAKLCGIFSQDINGDGILDASEGCIAIVISRTLRAAEVVCKYRPACPVLVVSTDEKVLRQANAWFAMVPCKVDKIENVEDTVTEALKFAKAKGMSWNNVIIVSGNGEPYADNVPEITVEKATDQPVEEPSCTYRSPFLANATVCSQKLILSNNLILNNVFNHRSTKIIATIGPSCWTPQVLSTLLDNGISCARFKLSFGDEVTQKAWIDIFRLLCAARKYVYTQQSGVTYTPTWSVMASIKGPQVRSSILRKHKQILLEEGQDIILVGVGEEYKDWEGFKDPETGLTKVGISYENISKVVKPGDRVMLGDGVIKLEVTEILNEKEVKCRALNTKYLWENRRVYFPGKNLALPLLDEKDEQALAFAAENKVDFITVPRCKHKGDIQLVRSVLKRYGGSNIQLIAEVDNDSAIRHFEELLEAADGIMISRCNLGVFIPAGKVCLAQKWMITKANLAGKPVFVAEQILQSMVDNPRPTRSEITDVANAAYDGADGIVLTTETATGVFPHLAVRSAAAILQDAEVGIDHYEKFNFIRNFTPKPMSTIEAICSSAVKAAVDMSADVVCVMTDHPLPVQLLCKYRPNVAIVVVTTNAKVASTSNVMYGCVPLLIEQGKEPETMEQLRDQVVIFAQNIGLFNEEMGATHRLVLVAGPIHSRMATEEDLNEMEFTSMLFGEDCGDSLENVGYHGDDTIAYRSTKVSLDLVCNPVEVPRKTKILCTLGPKCWTEEGIGALIDAGMNVARFNFSHGGHDDHQQVLDRVVKVAAQKNSKVALLLDTKGPEIRTAMLRDHKPIDLEADQDIIIVAVGDAYTTWEGYKDEETGETKIGLSYAHLCQDVQPGYRILIGDGTITVTVEEILSDTELRGKVMNSKKLGERKNCNLPGVKVNMAVLQDKDIDDVKNFACKNHMDFIAASFVQTAEDVRFIKRVLAEGGGSNIKIIAKIESWHGLQNYDDILNEADGIMVARGDLAMEIPSEKVALAQKMMITKANIAGKFIITATQMLESMIENPLPTRAEMTDVANAVFDGTDAVMLSGETANGQFPTKAVSTMAAIVANAEMGSNYYQVYNFIRDFTSKPVAMLEAVVSGAAKNVLDTDAGLIIVVAHNGDVARRVSKYRPRVPVLFITTSLKDAKQSSTVFAVYPYVVEKLPLTRDTDFEIMLEDAMAYAVERGLCKPGKEVVVIHGTTTATADGSMATLSTKVTPGIAAEYVPQKSQKETLSLRTTAISMSDITAYYVPPRKTKIFCTLGPSCWSEEGLVQLLNAGMNVARFNFSHGTHEAHQEVLDRLRMVSLTEDKRVAYLLDTKGPEIRTAMLRNGENIELEAGQDIILEAVGAAYDTFEGYKDKVTGETRIGISYEKLCSSVKPGNKILIADGGLSIEVVSILSSKELRGKCLNHKILGQRKNVNLPGVHVDIPVLTPKDIDDLQNFCVKNKMDFVAASFVQSVDDVRFIRRILDEAGGQYVKIISKIENEAGLENFDEILNETDGVMVARGDLAMEIPSEKVALAQKMLITKANVAGKFVITATQMLESMVTNPLPTRAEMTDVANAVFDGTDAVMLSGETANGAFPDVAVKTMAAIVANAENGNAYSSFMTFIRDHSALPFTVLEAFGVSTCSSVLDCNAQMIITISERGHAARMVSKFRSIVPQIVVTTDEHVANQANAKFGQYAVLVPSLDQNELEVEDIIDVVKAYATRQKLWNGEGNGIVLHGKYTLCADTQPVLRSAVLGRSLSGKLSSRSFSMRV